MGKEARINAKKRAARIDREKALFDRVVKRITAQNPHIYCEVFCVDASLFNLVREKPDDLEIQVCVRKFCSMGQVVDIYHMVYGEDAHGALEVRHQCILYNVVDKSTHGAHGVGKLYHASRDLFQFSALVNNLLPKTGDLS
ncbi:hypothetical protein NRY67_09390 [Acidithiobacillus ferrooxidans]|uniref:hypothetical protein n=1 Tax=Acidithiobacillus ferrooxidans TaxID=920 RepID=UPI00214891A8|nr:hypothetical protein [Acidithiobacillus ferrooxidans]MCR1342804.1 hypothetical protein [Acidithiobacillus ferrooxidans]